MKEFPASIMVCNTGGVILEMNDRACETYSKDGGRDLVGQSVLDCHPEPARSRLKKILDEQLTNCYTIEKNGARKLITRRPGTRASNTWAWWNWRLNCRERCRILSGNRVAGVSGVYGIALEGGGARTLFYFGHVVLYLGAR
jgi:PAS domain-containing protein